MRLLYLTRECNIHDLRFLQAFTRHGATVGFASLGRPRTGEQDRVLPQGARDFGNLGLDSKPSTGELLAAASSFREMAAEFLPDLVLAGPVHDGAFVAAHAGLGCRWVAQSWAFDVLWETERDADALARARIVLQKCPALLADSQTVLQKCEAIAGQPIKKRFLLPWGIDLASTRPAKDRSTARAELGLQNQTVFLCTRGLEPLYRIDVLLEGFRKFLASGRNAVLFLASEGTLRSRFEAWIKASQLTDSVKFLGAVDHHRLLDLFGAVDFYVSSAESDGASIALLEAMYLGLIPIVSDVGGNPEWVQHGVNGWLAQPGDADDFARAMTRALEMSDSQRRNAIQLNYDLIHARADWALNFSKLLPDLAGFSNLPEVR